MIKQLLLEWLRNAAENYALNPQDISLHLATRDAEGNWSRALIARIDADRIAEVLSKSPQYRVLEFTIGEGKAVKIKV